MRWAIVLAALGATSASANSTPDFGPPPAWVKRVPLPPVPAASDSPLRILLVDEQVDLSRGTVARFAESALVVQTAAGLSAGNVAIGWRPDVDTLTIHALTLRRGAKTIDVLATQKFTVIRRETNLENAMLDGRLTATLQIEGVEVGDVVNLAMTLVTRDPVVAGHVENAMAQWNGMGIDHAHSRLHWAKDVPLRVQQASGLPIAKPVADATGHSIELTVDNIKPIIPPKAAPARFGLGRLLEATDYASWASLAALMAPLYEQAEQIDPTGPFAAQIEVIRAASNDPKVRAGAALSLVEDKVRYLALEIGAGGLVPAKADASWANKLGDCKAKTVLLLAALHRLGIAAVPVLMSSKHGDGLDAHLPMAAWFDHVLVRATIAGQDYWLDGTRTGDHALAALEVPNFYWGLPLLARGSQLVALRPTPRAAPDTEFAFNLDMSGGIYAPAPVHADVVFRGDAAQVAKAGLAAVPEASRDAVMTEYWKQLYNFVTPGKVSGAYDPATGIERLTMDGTAELKWKDGYWRIPGSSLAYEADFSRLAGANADAPFATNYPAFERATATVKLPPHVSLWAGEVGHDVDQTLAGVAYHRDASVKDGVAHLTKSERVMVPEVSAASARADQVRLRRINDEDVHLDEDDDYVASDADLVGLAKLMPDSSDSYFERGMLYFHRQHWKEAIADLNEAQRLDPKDAETFANRAVVHLYLDQKALGEADIAAATAIEPGNAVALRARGLLAVMRHDDKAALAAFGASLVSDPGNQFALNTRSEIENRLGQSDAALADLAKIVSANPGNVDARLARANILVSQGKEALAMGEADALRAESPNDEYAVSAAAKIYAHSDPKRGMEILNSAIAKKPQTLLYLNRYAVRERSDLAGRRGDIDAAMKLDPTDLDTRSLRASFLFDTGDYAGAIAMNSAILAQEPNDAEVLARRSAAYARSGDRLRAQHDLDAAVAVSGLGPHERNSLCWTLATENIALDVALAQCSLAVAEAPANASYIDSRGLVNLRLGRLDAAMADYDTALKLAPKQAASLFGRALVWTRKGDTARAAADKAAAIAIAPRVAEAFKDYGLTLP